MRFFVGILLASLGCRGQTDQTGCPFDASGAVGSPCRDEGKECGETSLCDPCTSDLSSCELIRCSDGVWVELNVPDMCEA